LLLIPIPNYYFPLNIVWRSVGLDFIKTLQRTNETGAMQDNLAYNYNTDKNNNQLTSVTDAVASTVSLNDIENQAAGNYVYDAIGQLTENVGEKTKYRYNTQGLVTEVQYSNQAVVRFFYNERGQRQIVKKPHNLINKHTKKFGKKSKKFYF
jgi:YD repeat-containing protein